MRRVWRAVRHLATWDSIEPGLLTDEDITKLGEAGLLIVKGFDPAQVQQTCYELRVGDTAYFLSREETRRKTKISKDPEEGVIILRPRDVVTIITLEEVDLPAFVVGRVFTKGSLFSVGINPVVTYIDPGFAGNLGITLMNNANRDFRLIYGEAVCKVEFQKLHKAVKRPYRGIHFFASEVWPFQVSHLLPPRQLTREQIRDDQLFESEMDYIGEPFDLLAARVRDLGVELKRLWRLTRFVLLLLVGGITFYLAGPTVGELVDMYSLAPASVQGGLVSGVLQLIGAILAAVVAWYLSGIRRSSLRRQ